MEKELTEFWAHRKNKDGRQGYCIPCAKDVNAKWDAAHPEHKAAHNASAKGVASRLCSGHGYPRLEADIVATILLDDETRCSICGIPNWLVKLNYRKGGFAFVGPRAAHARMNADRIDTTQPHSLANTRPLCGNCNIRRGAELHTDVEVLRWIRRQWEGLFPPRLLFWLNTEPGKGGRSRRNPGRTDGPERGLAT